MLVRTDGPAGHSPRCEGVLMATLHWVQLLGILGCWRFWPKVEIVGFMAQNLSHRGGTGIGTGVLLGGMVTSWRWVEERRRFQRAANWHGLTVPHGTTVPL